MAPAFARLSVQTLPPINDPRELETIVISSLRGLWGELEIHSTQLRVSKDEEEEQDDEDDRAANYLESQDEDGAAVAMRRKTERTGGGLLHVHCPVTSVKAVHAALTLITPPPYLDDQPYRIDVVKITTTTTPP
jgi:hypothetical protein